MTSHNRRSDLRRPALRQRPRLEALEGRQLMSLGSEFQVNSLSDGDQFDSASAGALTGGRSVTVWTHTFSPTDHDIHARLFAPDGTPSLFEMTISGSTLDEG